MSLRLRLLTLFLRGVAKPWSARVSDPIEARRDMERLAGWATHRMPGALCLPLRLGGRPALSVRVGPARQGALVLYFHGGGHLAGAPRTHLAVLTGLARYGRVEVIALDQRLAPEHPFPAAIEDAEAAWDELRARGYRCAQIVLAGDSAVGGIALALLARLCARGTPPAGLVGLSPWTDLTGTSPSIDENARSEAMLVAERLHEIAALYLQDTPADDPQASPLFAAYPDCPPILLQCSDTEILRDDSLRMADRLRGFGGEVTVQLWPDAPHVWQLFLGWVPEARAALRDAGRAVQAMLSAPPRQR